MAGRVQKSPRHRLHSWGCAIIEELTEFHADTGQCWRLRQTSQLAEIPWDHDDAVRPLLSWLK